jgi:methylthioribulose-1-phosphate dehydratase
MQAGSRGRTGEVARGTAVVRAAGRLRIIVQTTAGAAGPPQTANAGVWDSPSSHREYSMHHATTRPHWTDHAYRDQLSELGRYFHSRGWTPATSGNFSVVVDRDPLRLLVTVSGTDKGRLQPDDFVVVDAEGRAEPHSEKQASAEVLLHVEIARLFRPHAIVHTHSVWNTLVSQWDFDRRAVEITDFELQKGLTGVRSHDSVVRLAIFDNTQNMSELAGELRQYAAARSSDVQYGFLIRRHGMYTWGASVDEARRHAEALEFLLECRGRQFAAEWQIGRDLTASGQL